MGVMATYCQICGIPVQQFASMIADGHGWMLADPNADNPDGRRNRDRVLSLLGV
jgi:hypothetical protein